jgi:hypothetical protein
MRGGVHGSGSLTKERFVLQYAMTVLKLPPGLCQRVIVFIHLKVSVDLSGVWQCLIPIDVPR